jgi:4,5-DOPA dioxygenase extradiol
MSKILPSFFIGHGSPMNTIEDNQITRGWKKEFTNWEDVQAILLISAHYLTTGTKITSHEKNPIIYDFFGFPEELYFTNYESKGSKEIASKLSDELKIEIDSKTGLDHGSWSILKQIQPPTSIPILQLSLDVYKTIDRHFEFAKELNYLRRQGYLLIGSGNIVHNLNLLNFRNMNEELVWVKEFDSFIRNSFTNQDFESLIYFQNKEKEFRQAHPSIEHYLPFLYIIANLEETDSFYFFNTILQSSISMTSLKIFNKENQE